MATKTFIKHLLDNSPFVREYESSSRKEFLFEETMELTTRKLDQLTLADSNRYYMKIIERPAIFEVNDDQMRAFEILGRLMCSYSTQFTGFQSITMSKLEATTRSEFQGLRQPGEQTGATTTVTIVFPGELANRPIYKTISWWLNQMKDRISKKANLGGLNKRYTAGLISMTALFIKPDPSNKAVEYSCIGQNMWPLNLPAEQNDGNWNDVTVQEVSIEFNINVLDCENMMVQEYAEAVLEDIDSRLCGDSTLYGSPNSGTALEIVTQNPIL